MTNRREAKFDQLTKKTWRLVEILADSTLEKPLPVPLHELARELNIRFIQFEPLLGTAGLVKIKDGFAIMVNTEAPGATQKKSTILNTNSDDWDELKPPLRFTFAHEIAHVLYFNAAEGKWRNDIFNRHAKKLESECSKMARVILMPKQRLHNEIKNHIFDVEHIRKLLHKFCVSAEVFVRRLQLLDIESLYKNTSGLLAFAQEQEGSIRFKACRLWGIRARSRFGTPPRSAQKSLPLSTEYSENHDNDSNYPEGHSLEEVISIPEIEALLRQEGRIHKKIEVPCAHDKSMNCIINCYQINKSPRSFLVAIEITGSLI